MVQHACLCSVLSHLHHFKLPSSLLFYIHFRGSVFTFSFVSMIYTVQYCSLPRECSHICSSSPPNVFLWSSNHREGLLGELFGLIRRDAVCSILHNWKIWITALSRFNILDIYMDLNVLMCSVWILLQAFKPWERKRAVLEKRNTNRNKPENRQFGALLQFGSLMAEAISFALQMSAVHVQDHKIVAALVPKVTP